MKEKRLLFGILLISWAMTTGCAVMNTSILETAETVEPGHFKIGVETGSGIDLSTAVVDEEEFEGESNLGTVEFLGLKTGIGIIENLELNAKWWVAGFGAGFATSMGMKAYLKARIPLQTETMALSILPGLSYVRSINDDELSLLNGVEVNFKAKSVGGELPVVFSYRFHKKLSLYGATRYSFDRLTVEDFTATLHRVGLIGGISVNAGYFYLRPEIGIETAKQTNQRWRTGPIVGLGFGFEW